MRYRLDMTKWNARIEVVRDEKVIGWAEIKDVVTETIPRVGERVLFGNDIVSERLMEKLPLSSADMPMVVQVEHLVGRSSTQVVVVVRASLAPHVTDAALENLRPVEDGWTLRAV